MINVHHYYYYDLCLQHYTTPFHILCTASDTLSLQTPQTRFSPVGSFAFSVFGPSTWNGLLIPFWKKKHTSLGSFQSNLSLTCVTCAQYCVHQASQLCHIYVSKSGGCFVRIGNETWEKYETLICQKLQPFDFILQKKKKKKKAEKKLKNWFRNKEVMGIQRQWLYVWWQSRKNSWRQELLHSRIAGNKRVKLFVNCISCTHVCGHLCFTEMK